MELSQLVTLLHVAELGSLSKAADRLNIVQPALSRQIRLLEAELGAPLFERHGRGMALTEAGQGVVEQAVRVLAEVEALRARVEEGATRFRGLLRIGTTPTLAELLTVPLMHRVRSEHPDLSMRFTSAFSGYLMDWLKRGDLDLAFSYSPPPTKALRIEPVMMEQLCLIGAGEGGAGVQPLRFSELEGRPLVLPSPAHGLREVIDACARRAGVGLTLSVEADSYVALVDLVRAGFGETILPLAPLYRQLQSGELHARPLTDPVPERKLVLCYAADRPVTAATKYLGETLKDLILSQKADGIWGGTILHPNPSSSPKR